ncbi:Enhancer of rudimentary homolog [Linum perenne]
MANRHTIILMQASPNRATRTFMDYGSVSQAMEGCLPAFLIFFFSLFSTICIIFTHIFNCHLLPEIPGICGLYERKLKEINPALRNISYDIADLYNFIDGLADMSALVYDQRIQAYLPYDRQWIKQKTFQHLKMLAAQ